MSDPTSFLHMRELLRALDARLDALEGGRLRLEDLDGATAEARELFERLIVLRHLAREQRVRPLAAAPPPATAAGAPPMRLDTRPRDERQISLIDIISEEEKVDPPAQAPPAAPPPAAAPPARSRATVAEKLERAPIKDLGRAIAVSQKFWFINELFGRDASAYELAIKSINTSGDIDAARTYFTNEVVARLKKAPDEEVVGAFMELVERRFA